MELELEPMADAGFSVSANNLSKLFEDAAISFMDMMVDTHQVLRKESREIVLSAGTKEELMCAWLSSIKELFDSEELVVSEFVVEILPSDDDLERLIGSVWGEKLDLNRHKIRAFVKTIILGQLKVFESADGWKAEILVDV